LAEAVEKSSYVKHAVETQIAIPHGACECLNALGTSGRQTDPGKIGAGERVWRRKQMRKAVAGFERLAEFADEARRQRGSSFHSDLLAQHGANGDFEPVPGTGNTQAGIGRQRAPQKGIGAEMSGYFARVGVEVEHVAQALDDEEEPARIGKADAR